jgi:hypothetical protein
MAGADPSATGSTPGYLSGPGGCRVTDSAGGDAAKGPGERRRRTVASLAPVVGSVRSFVHGVSCCRACNDKAPSSLLYSQRLRLLRTRSHSPSSRENYAVSRFRCRTTRCCRKMPSKVKPSRSAAVRDFSLRESHFHSTRRHRRRPKASSSIR